MPEMIEYAVRVKGTCKYLPRPQRRDGRGGSHLEPVDFSDRSTWPERYSKDMQIRSFTTERAAKNLLASWCKGKFVAHRWVSDEDYDEEIELLKGTGRDPEAMEVCSIIIVFPG